VNEAQCNTRIEHPTPNPDAAMKWVTPAEANAARQNAVGTHDIPDGDWILYPPASSTPD